MSDSPSFYTRKEICNECKYRLPKGCALYIKPCTVKQLWHDQIDPPTLCPKANQFNEDNNVPITKQNP